MATKTYKKLIANKHAANFKSAIEILEVPIPEITFNEVLIRNQFAGINAGFDTLICRGDISYVKLAPPFDLGVEAVGEVIAVGSDVKHLLPGDNVVTIHRGGGYREYQCVDANITFKVPQATPEVLTLMPTGVSALVALEQAGEMKSNEVVLVTAAAGGTGHIAVQLAKFAGNRVIGTCSSQAKAQLLKELGCERAINYRSEDLNQILKKEYPNGVNLIFDCVGKAIFDTCVENLAVKGRLVIIGFISEYGNKIEEVTQPRIYHQLFWKAASVRGFLMPLYQEYAAPARERLLNLFYDKKLKVVVDSTQFKGIESIPNAVEYMLSGQNCGKVVVRYE